MKSVADWTDLALLAGDGPTMRLPRRSSPPRNVKIDSSEPDDMGSEGLATGWDWLDYLAIFGIVVAAVGVILTFVPPTRSYGLLVPIGLSLTTLVAYVARGKDGSGA